MRATGGDADLGVASRRAQVISDTSGGEGNQRTYYYNRNEVCVGESNELVRERWMVV